MLADLRLAWRRLVKAPGFTVTAVMILTFAIGANAAVFSVADAALFRPLPYHAPDNLYILRMTNQRTGQGYGLTPYRYSQTINQPRRRKANDPVLTIIAALIVISVAVLAAYAPARRVSRIDPLVVLRAE